MAPRPRLLIVLTVLVLAALACNLSGDAPPAEQEAITADAPTVEIRVPVNGQSFAEGTQVIIQVAAMDAGAGVSRIDLQIDDLAHGSATAPTAAGQSAFITTFDWVAQGQGLHSLTAIAFRADGTPSAPQTISVNVVAAPPTQAPTDPPAPTDAPADAGQDAGQANGQADGQGGGDGAAQQQEPTEPPTATPIPASPTPDVPRATTNAGANIRNGPSTYYPIIDAITAGWDMVLTGRNQAGDWFQIDYGGLREGWIWSQLLTTSGDTGSLPVVNVPPPPPTPVPATPIPTAPPVTNTPTGPSVRYWSTVEDGRWYEQGTCFTFFWEVSGVSEIYFDGQGVPGTGQQEACPGPGVRRYDLRVVLTDGSEEIHTVVTRIEE